MLWMLTNIWAFLNGTNWSSAGVEVRFQESSSQQCLKYVWEVNTCFLMVWLSTSAPEKDPTGSTQWWAWYYSMASIASNFFIFSISALMLTYYDAQYQCNTSYKLCKPLWSLVLNAPFFTKFLLLTVPLFSNNSKMNKWLTAWPVLGVAWTMLIAPSTMPVSVIFPFKGKSSISPLIISPCSYIVFCHMIPNSFSNISQHTRCTLGWAQLVIGLIMLPGMQVRRLVVLEL